MGAKPIFFLVLLFGALNPLAYADRDSESLEHAVNEALSQCEDRLRAPDLPLREIIDRDHRHLKVLPYPKMGKGLVIPKDPVELNRPLSELEGFLFTMRSLFGIGVHVAPIWRQSSGLDDFPRIHPLESRRIEDLLMSPSLSWTIPLELVNLETNDPLLKTLRYEDELRQAARMFFYAVEDIEFFDDELNLNLPHLIFWELPFIETFQVAREQISTILKDLTIDSERYFTEEGTKVTQSLVGAIESIEENRRPVRDKLIRTFAHLISFFSGELRDEISDEDLSASDSESDGIQLQVNLRRVEKDRRLQVLFAMSYGGEDEDNGILLGHPEYPDDFTIHLPLAPHETALLREYHQHLELKDDKDFQDAAARLREKVSYFAQKELLRKLEALHAWLVSVDQNQEHFIDLVEEYQSVLSGRTVRSIEEQRNLLQLLRKTLGKMIEPSPPLVRQFYR